MFRHYCVIFTELVVSTTLLSYTIIYNAVVVNRFKISHVPMLLNLNVKSLKY